MKPLSEEINKIIKKVFKAKNPLLAELIVNWGKIVGGKYQDKSYPLNITKGREKGKKIYLLHVAVTNSAISMEMSFQQDIMIERIAVYLGYKAIHKMRFVIR